MKLKVIIRHLKKEPMDAWYYIQGNFRYNLFRSKYFQWMLRKHIKEQFIYRRDVAARACYLNGSCLCCGCDTPELFFSAKACSVGKLDHCKHLVQCYPQLMGRKTWEHFKQ